MESRVKHLSSASMGLAESTPWTMAMVLDTKAQAVSKQVDDHWANRSTKLWKALLLTLIEEDLVRHSSSLRTRRTCGKTSTGTSGTKLGRPHLRITTTSSIHTKTPGKAATSRRIHTRRLPVIRTPPSTSALTGLRGLTEITTR